MKKTWLLSLTVFGLNVLGLSVLPSQALVPGPILLSKDQVQVLRQDPQRQLNIPTSRAKASCLLLGQEMLELCPGQSRTTLESLLQNLPQNEQQQIIPFYQKDELQALAVLLPAEVSIPAPNFDSDPMDLSSTPATAPLTVQTLMEQLPGFPVQQAFSEVFAFSETEALNDLQVWYYADLHLGLIGRPSEQGSYLLGVFVAK